MPAPTLIDKVEAMAALACIKELTPAALKAGIRLLHHYNCKTRRCDPGTGVLAAATGLTERTIYRAIDELETLGLFRIDHRRGRSRTNRYQPDFKRIMAFNLTSWTGYSSAEPADSENPTSLTRKPDNSSLENPTVLSGKHMKEHVKEHMAGRLRKPGSGLATQQTKFARQTDQSTKEPDPKFIDWASWDRALQTIGIHNGTDWIFGALERAESEAGLSKDKAYLLVDRCLRKALATSLKNRTLDELLTEAIAKQRDTA